MAAKEALVELPGRLVHVRVGDADEAGLRVLLGDVRAAQRALDALAVRVAARADQLALSGRSAGAVETMRAAGAVGARQARREAARAAAAGELPGLVDAMAAGRISGEQVDSIARHRDRLSERDRAGFDAQALIDRAAGMPPETFDRLVKKQANAVVGDGGLGDMVARQTASEFRHWFDRDTGMGRFAGALDPERYEMLTNTIDQRVASLAAAEKGATKNQHLAARALVELVVGSTSAGGSTRSGRPSVTVVVDHQTITTGRHDRTICQTEQGHDLPTESLSRICCDATLRRVTLDKRGVPLAVGRQHRTATDGQWAAIKALYTTCAWDGCTAPIGWCQAHHILEWDNGGRTDLNNLVPLCSTHHHRVHEGRWHIKLAPDRTLHLHRPDGTHHSTVPPPMRC
ncbi:MAG: HNH endonuclease [Actinomycetota bacterium]